MKKIKMKYLSFLIVAIITSFIAGCSGKEADESVNTAHKKLPLAELNFAFAGPSINPDMLEIAEEISKKTADTLNIKLNMQWINYEEYDETIKKAINSGSTIDAFGLRAYTLRTYLGTGDIKDITQLFPQNAPDIYKLLDRSELAQVTDKGKLYAIPGKSYESERRYAVIRADLASKYGIKEIKSLEDYEAYLKTVSEKEMLLLPPFIDAREIISAYLEYKGFVDLWGTGLYYNRYDNEFKLIPMESLQEYREAEALLRSWVQKKLIDSAGFTGRYEDDQFNSSVVDYQRAERFLTSGPQVPLRMYPLYPQSMCSRRSSGLTYTMAFSNNSRKVDRAIKFINWVGSRQENYDLLMYGIKDSDYKLVKGKVELIRDEVNNKLNYHYLFKTWGGQFFENLEMNRPLVNQPDDYWKEVKKNYEKLSSYPIHANFTGTGGVSKEEAERYNEFFRNRAEKLRELQFNNEALKNGYSNKLQEFKEQQQQAGLSDFIGYYQKVLDYCRKNNK